ncbi:MAG: hypothetical protein DMF63_03885 [Acidobacteria bacterium]|nr:MAG: hypothetical protein DMF63_03885 [Acidobacteriota bacterium]
MKNPAPTRIARVLVLSILFAVGAFGNTTTYDPTFDGAGYRLQPVGAGSGHGYSLAIQSDGKIVVGGSTRIGNESDKLALIRLNADGTLDTSFGSGGTAFSPMGMYSSIWEVKVVIQSDGKILLGSTARLTQQSREAFTVLRFMSSGVLDTTFNGTGYATANVPNSLLDTCHSMDLQADGKIVLVGSTLEEVPGDISGNRDIAIVRFNANGSLDSTFDSDGIVKVGALNPDEEGHAVLVQADGKIIVGGRETTDRERYLLTRFNANGSTDTSFGTGGWNIFAVDFVNNNFTSLARRSDGRILAAGGGKTLRFSVDGARDMSFGANGVSTVPGTIESGEIRVIAGDKFLLANRYGVRRFMPNGAIDTNFGRDFTVSGNNCYSHSISVQSDGKAVLGGVCTNSSDQIERFAVARFQENRTKRYLDFDGNEGTDISIYRPANGQWWYLGSLFYQIVAGQFGTSTDRPVPAEFSGDGKTDLAVFRPSTGEWYVLRSDDRTFYSFPFGTAGDIPVVGDFDDDQLADAGVFRPSTNLWYIQKSTGGISITAFGTSGDKPVPSDYDGDFKLDIAIYRPSVGQWWIQRSSDGGVYAFQFGNSTDKPVQADYTGDNKTDAAFYRPSTGEWFVLRSEDYSYFAFPFGLGDDLPAPGNYWGDARFDIAVFRPSENRWHILGTGGWYFYEDFGVTGDVPLPTMVMP